MKLAIGAAILAAVAQAAVPYTNCGTSADLLSNVVVNATPNPPVPGKAVDIDVTGTLSTAVKSGKYTLSVAYDGITIITKTGDLGSLTTLPVAAGPLKVAKSETLPSSVPAGSYTAKISATANGGAALFCADVDLKIGESGMIEDVQMATRLGQDGHGIDHSADYVDMEFDAFIKEHNKEYLKGTEEYRERRKVFGANFAHIKTHNVRYEAGEVTHYLGVNQFADLTAAEFANRRGWMVGQRPRKENNDMPTDDEFAALPTSIDWTTKGVVTPVKNQGQCGSCWSFSTTGSIESRSAIASGKLISLSEQQLMDCSTSFGNQGCNGGQMDDAFKYVIQTGGLSTETCDPYQTADESCGWKADGCQLNDPIQGYHDVQHNCEKCMMAAVAEGPVSIAVDASGMDWQLYSGGVIGSGCGQQLDHGVLAVGYGSINGQDMWKVKNSWGASWGNSGYLYIARGSDNVCGILSDPSYPCVKSAGNGDC